MPQFSKEKPHVYTNTISTVTDTYKKCEDKEPYERKFQEKP